ncbi:MAG TPA: 4-hydroxy-tetrahydrodipicolinate synthase [Bacillota bacterium]|nr:4-hydroxy-tetrahydrodipicolinate synthase [Bacillota bacterium]
MRESSYGSVIIAMVTPFTSDLEIDYGTSVRLAQSLSAQGADGILVSGTTGESPTLTPEEKIRLVSEVRSALPRDVMVWAGTSSYNTKDSVELTRRAEDAGADGILAVTPYYNKPSQEGLYRHFKAISESTSLPIMLYNVPGRTSVNILPETVLRLAELKNVRAIKEASGNLDQVSMILRGCPESFFVYSGDDSLTLPILSLGGSGIVSVAGHLVAQDLKNMIQCFGKGEVKEAWSIHHRLFELFKVLFITTNPVPVKTALEMVGVPVGGFRLPLCGPSDKELKAIREVLVKMGFLAAEGE